MMPAGLRVMMAVEPVDMRRSFDGLVAKVMERFATDVRGARTMFVFVNRQRTTLKILWADEHGLFVLGRRLDGRVVELPRDIRDGATSVAVNMSTLAMLLQGTPAVRHQTRRDVAGAAREAVELRMSTRKTQPPT